MASAFKLELYFRRYLVVITLTETGYNWFIHETTNTKPSVPQLYSK